MLNYSELHIVQEAICTYKEIGKSDVAMNIGRELYALGAISKEEYVEILETALYRIGVKK